MPPSPPHACLPPRSLSRSGGRTDKAPGFLPGKTLTRTWTIPISSGRVLGKAVGPETGNPGIRRAPDDTVRKIIELRNGSSALTSFDELTAWIEAGDIERVTGALLAAGDEERRAFTGPLTDFTLTWLPRPSLDARPGETPHDAQTRQQAEAHAFELSEARREAALCVAGVACLPRAPEIVSWLKADRFRRRLPAEAVDAIVRLLRSPGRAELPAVATALADRLRPPQNVRLWPVVNLLLEAAELPPPSSEAVVRGWIQNIRESGRPLAEALRTPRTPLFLQHVFTIPRIGTDLGDDWPPALAQLSADGLYDRQAMLDGCLLRLRSDDRPGAMRPFVELLRHLDPTLDEYAAHRDEYLDLLSSPHLAIADQALHALQSLDAAGRLEMDAIVEASYAVLPRKDKKLVREHLDWIGDTLTRTNEPALFDALLAGLASEAADLQERTLKIAIRHLPAYGDAGREALAGAATPLDGDLRRQALAALGTDAEEEPVQVPLSVSPPAPMPAPIASPAQLADALSVLFRGTGTPMLEERVLDALAVFAHADRPALTDALGPLQPPHPGPWADLLRAVAERRWTESDQGWDELQARPASAMYAERIRELGRQLCGTPPPGLLATPSTTVGHVDPARVFALLTTADSDGWQPGPYDLSQALLRLPRDVDPGIRAAATELSSPAGHAFAGWLRDGGLADPDVDAVMATRQACRHVHDCDSGRQPHCRCLNNRRLPCRTVTFTPVGHPALTVPPGLLALTEADAVDHLGYAYGTAAWPAVLPSHREVVAAHLQLVLAQAGDGTMAGELAHLPALARCDGPFGPAMAQCLAYGLGAARSAGRTATVDAFLMLAARGILDSTLVARELAELYSSGALVLKRVIDGLDQAHRAGATDHVWSITRDLLPAVLTAPGPGAPDLLKLAESAAAACLADDELPEVASVAARGRRTRLGTEAARLQRTLTENHGQL
ncbi:DUF6493 family protein [Actinoplanes sp. NBRC 101535]|uniref:DUF6493 family protein n=1 Tax=Actinoplanes sp. NBRC 101535 TaxID=3032196 RepID=UPI0024A19F6F|nr:DUF6493 family protein [Actinoplanes sp. NBRC 101535]GLY03892.1 hypothetical protein Acsp01_42710 [Actinoplanes sp. NBRC 101535]